jgi:hypothetical protein
MHLCEVLRVVASSKGDSIETFSRHLDPQWIEEALVATGTATVRRRRLPAAQVLWLVLGMALFRDKSIQAVADSLGLALPDSRRTLVAKSAIAKARQRLGDAPLEYLFAATGSEWATRSAEQHRYRDLALFTYDGTCAQVADTPANVEAFGRHSNKRGDAGYPSLRIVALMAARSHLIGAVRFGDIHTGEKTLARELWRELPDDSMSAVDRGFLVASDLIHLERSGRNRHWISRAREKMKWRVVEKLGRDDDLVEYEISSNARADEPDLPRFWRMRAIRYQRKGFRPSTILTSLVDAARYPAAELVVLYHERWEIEVAYDEIKTHLLNREEAFRSKTPVGVRQELLGTLLMYNLIRLEMERVATIAGVEPNRISFVYATALIQQELWWLSNTRSPGAIPRQLVDLEASLKRLILPPRTQRSNRREVKLKYSKFPRKPPTNRPAK